MATNEEKQANQERAAEFWQQRIDAGQAQRLAGQQERQMNYRHHKAW